MKLVIINYDIVSLLQACDQQQINLRPSMKVFISYKFKNHHDKNGLKENLEKISKLIESWGDSTYILGRDYKRWKHIHMGFLRLIPVIFKNMRTCDIIYAYVDSEARSKGLFFELLISKILGKKSIMFLKGDLDVPLAKFLAYKTVEIESIEDINRVSSD